MTDIVERLESGVDSAGIHDVGGDDEWDIAGANSTMRKAAAEITALRARVADMEGVLHDILRAEYESDGLGILDCKDNNGDRYQSAFLDSALKRAETLLAHALAKGGE